MSEGYEKRAEPFPEADYAELQKRETLAMLSPVIYKEGENEMSTQKLFVTKREKNWDEFVKLTEAGKSCKETADALGVSIQSVHLWRAELKKQRTSEKSEEVIKPEPAKLDCFCGGKPEVYDEEDEGIRRFGVCCMKCGEFVGLQYSTREEAIKAWNNFISEEKTSDNNGKIGNILDNSGNQGKESENSEQSEEEAFTRSYLQRIDLLIDTMAPICVGDDNTLQETAKLAYKILLHGLSDEFPTDEAKPEEEG
jgi:hypothetical protein